MQSLEVQTEAAKSTSAFFFSRMNVDFYFITGLLIAMPIREVAFEEHYQVMK